MGKFYYTRVTPMEILDHLLSMCSRLNALDLITLQSDMQSDHTEIDGIPEYINYLEDAQDKAEREIFASQTQC